MTETESTATQRDAAASAPGEFPLNVRLAGSLIRWSFLVFVFSIPFEVLDPFGIAETFSIAKFFALQFLLTSLLGARWTFARPALPFWYFLFYLVLFLLLGVAQLGLYGGQVADRLLTLSQLLVLFWVSANVLQEEGLIGRSLAALGLSCTAVAILRLSGVAWGGMQYGDLLRVSAFGQNPNSYALTLGIGLVALLGRTRLPLEPPVLLVRILYWVCCAVLFFEVLETGSRGATAALLAGLFVLYGLEGALWFRMVKGLAVLAAVLLLLLGPLAPETSRSRWEETFMAGDLAQRDVIFPAAVQMGIEKPVAGWGPVAHLYELGRRTQYPEGFRDTHNDLLWLWNEGGIIGTVPFAVGVWLCLRGAWRSRRGPLGVVPLAVLAVVLVMSMSGTLHFIKLFWIALAYGAAAGALHAGVQEEMRQPGSTP